MTTFITTNNLKFRIDIKTKDILAVKELVKYSDGKPVDILEAVETGTLNGIYGDIETFVNVVFVLCLDQIKQYFDLQKYNEDNRKTYDLFPEQESEPAITKASRWFGSIIDGGALTAMIAAFNEAVINFTPNENRRTALKTILEREKEIERMEAEYRIATVNRMFERTKDNLDKRWENLSSQKVKELETRLDGQFDKSGDTPE
jgi:hypothetical protein